MQAHLDDVKFQRSLCNGDLCVNPWHTMLLPARALALLQLVSQVRVTHARLTEHNIVRPVVMGGQLLNLSSRYVPEPEMLATLWVLHSHSFPTLRNFRAHALTQSAARS